MTPSPLLAALLPLFDYCRTELRQCKSIIIEGHGITMHQALLNADAAIAEANEPPHSSQVSPASP